jgi:serine/threonine protein kinase
MFQIQRIIGSGGFGMVVAARDRIRNKDVGLKIVFKRGHNEEMLRFEFETLK